MFKEYTLEQYSQENEQLLTQNSSKKHKSKGENSNKKTNARSYRDVLTAKNLHLDDYEDSKEFEQSIDIQLIEGDTKQTGTNTTVNNKYGENEKNIDKISQKDIELTYIES